ncbi:DDE superfamily endonuclease, CENP-B-like, partial [Kipferlia bialata]
LPFILIWDSFSCHHVKMVRDTLTEAKIAIMMIPPHTSHVTQPLDCCFNAAYHKAFKLSQNVIEGQAQWERHLIAACRAVNMVGQDIPTIRACFRNAGYGLDDTGVTAEMEGCEAVGALRIMVRRPKFMPIYKVTKKLVARREIANCEYKWGVIENIRRVYYIIRNRHIVCPTCNHATINPNVVPVADVEP